MLRSRFSLLLLPVLLLLMAFRQSPLVDPAPIAVPARTTPEQVVKAIKAALLHREWTVTAENPGAIDATLRLRDHVARIAVAYDAGQIQIKYVDSSNLKYEMKNGTRYIHTNYLGWIQNVVADLQSNLILFGS